MGRLIGFILMLLAIWTAAEIYTNGLDGAFGGVLGSAFEAPADRSTPDRAQDAFQRAYNSSERRVEDVLERDQVD
jgi:hypothetical protein